MDLLSANWWFNTIPLYSGFALRVFFVASLSLIIIGAAVRMVSKKRIKDKYQLETSRRIATMLVVMGTLGVWYWFVSFQQISFLSARFWTVTWVVGVLIWIGYVAKYVVKTIPEARMKLHVNKEKDKYMN